MNFGVDNENTSHYYVLRYEKKSSQVELFETFTNECIHKHKSTVSKGIFNIMKYVITQELNYRLKKLNLKSGRFSYGDNKIERLLGKELLLLFWSVEDLANVSKLDNIMRRWLSLSPEERWYLCTMTNAEHGHIDCRSGWRKAIKCIMGSD